MNLDHTLANLTRELAEKVSPDFDPNINPTTLADFTVEERYLIALPILKATILKKYYRFDDRDANAISWDFEDKASFMLGELWVILPHPCFDVIENWRETIVKALVNNAQQWFNYQRYGQKTPSKIEVEIVDEYGETRVEEKHKFNWQYVEWTDGGDYGENNTGKMVAPSYEDGYMQRIDDELKCQLMEQLGKMVFSGKRSAEYSQLFANDVQEFLDTVSALGLDRAESLEQLKRLRRNHVDNESRLIRQSA
jgi:hypothetical protein